VSTHLSLSEQVNQSDLVALVQTGPLRSTVEVADFLDGTEEERAQLISDARLRGDAPEESSWDEFVKVAGAVLTVAGAITGIASCISAVYAVKLIL
jgi:hypothetical protein